MVKSRAAVRGKKKGHQAVSLFISSTLSAPVYSVCSTISCIVLAKTHKIEDASVLGHFETALPPGEEDLWRSTPLKLTPNSYLRQQTHRNTGSTLRDWTLMSLPKMHKCTRFCMCAHICSHKAPERGYTSHMEKMDPTSINKNFCGGTQNINAKIIFENALPVGSFLNDVWSN